MKRGECFIIIIIIIINMKELNYSIKICSKILIVEL